MTEQKTFIVYFDAESPEWAMDSINTNYHIDVEGDAPTNLEDLEALLAQGWRIVTASPMSGTSSKYSTSLVVLER